MATRYIWRDRSVEEVIRIKGSENVKSIEPEKVKLNQL